MIKIAISPESVAARSQTTSAMRNPAGMARTNAVTKSALGSLLSCLEERFLKVGRQSWRTRKEPSDQKAPTDVRQQHNAPQPEHVPYRLAVTIMEQRNYRGQRVFGK